MAEEKMRAAEAEEQGTTQPGFDVQDFEAGETPETNGGPQEPGDNEDIASELNAEMESLRQQVQDHQEKVLRIQADYDNFRRRTRQEKEEFAKYASAKLLEELIPVVDNFERALAAGKETNDYDSLYKGLEMTFRQMDQVLRQEGLEPMDSVGKPFNPDFHQAIMQVESEDYEEGIVVEEVQKGYKLKEKVLRPAMVKVSG